MSNYEMVIGLEVHAQLATRTKLFCACTTDGFGSPANTRICPVCTGQPGALPVLNHEAVKLAFKAALALECKISSSIFARKNYFYPDLPKAYQISQYEQPFSSNGVIELRSKEGPGKRITIHRIHMEEDAGKLMHAVGAEKLEYSLVDFNRSSVPLIEIVSEPEMRSSDEAYNYLAALKEVLQYCGASHCDMEKGEMRCDANISVRLMGEQKLGTRAEIKNLNSFRGVKDALEYEFRRQVQLVEAGEKIKQETRLWDAEKGATFPMRSKEEAHDYRYFPDPDLLPLEASAAWVEEIKASLPELPAQRRSRFISEFQLSSYDSEVLTADRALGDYFVTATKGLKIQAVKSLVNFMTTELLGKLNASNLSVTQSPIAATSLGQLASLLDEGKLSSKLAKEVFAKMWETGKAPEALIRELGITQVSDEAQIKNWVAEALKANPKAAEDLKNGKERAIGAIVGTIMKLSKGQANPAVVNRLIKEAVQ